ncbi:MAG: Ig-like domain-containing protein, partial [Campylobacterota bacterium]|nr:Ig-like domain-containing protein [Campylobacterota bacterium]
MLIKYFLSSFLILLFFNGCSSGESTHSTTQLNDVLSARFVDSNVSGVEYINQDTNIKGTTDKNGSFSYVENTKVIFKIGGITLGEMNTTNIQNDSVIYPTDILALDINETNNTKTLKLIRMLQSLDTDNNPYNGIDINSSIATLLENSTLDFRSDLLTIEDLNSTLSDINKTFVSQDDALIHYEYTLQSNNLGVDTIAPIKPKILTIFPNQIITESFDLNISGERGTTIFVNDVNTTNNIDINGLKTITLDTTGDNGNKYFSIKLKDDAGFYSEEVNLTLYKNVNIAPVGTFTSFNTDEDIEYIGILTATDENNNSLTFSKISDPEQGTLLFDNNGSFTYTPSLNFYGEDSFSYIVNDTELNSTVSVVSISINPSVDNINAITQTLNTDEDTSLDLNLSIINNSFVNIDGLSISKIKISNLPSTGSLEINSLAVSIDTNISSLNFNKIKYIPMVNSNTSDSFSIIAFDGYNWSDEALVNIDIQSVNDNPIINTNNQIIVNENQTNAFTIDAFDIETTNLIYGISGEDVNYFNVNSSIGTVTFKNAPNYQDKNSYNITVTVNDGTTTVTKNITISISNIIDNIIPIEQIITMNEDDVFTFDSSIIANNFTNIDDLNISEIKIYALPTNGTLKLNGINSTIYQKISSIEYSSITYTPNTDYNGTDRIKIKAFDGYEWSDYGYIDFTITNINDTPEIISENNITVEENQINVVTLEVSDPDNNILTYDIYGDDSDYFNFDTSSNDITFKNTPNYEDKQLYQFIVSVSDSIETVTQNITVNVENVPETTPTISNFSTSIYPNAIDNIEIGTINIISSGDTDITSIEL